MFSLLVRAALWQACVHSAMSKKRLVEYFVVAGVSESGSEKETAAAECVQSSQNTLSPFSEHPLNTLTPLSEHISRGKPL